MSREIVHFAGQQLQIGNVVRQRCLWCGAIIEERDLERIAVQIQPGETEEEAIAAVTDARWSGLVAVDGNVRYAVPDPPDGKVPGRACSEVLPAEL